MTATITCLAITDADAAEAIGRCYQILARARERAWQTGGPCVLFAMTVLRNALRDYARAACEPGSDVTVAVLCAEAAAEHLITIIRRDCGDDEAAYVQEGDEN